MSTVVRILTIVILVCGISAGLFAQQNVIGLKSAKLQAAMAPQSVRSIDKVTSALVGPVFPPPLPINFLSVGGPGAAGRASGNNWYFSGVQLSNFTTVYWGPVNGQVLLSLDGGSFSASESLHYSAGASNLANGYAVWQGGSQYWNKFGFGPYAIATQFTMTVTDSATGAPIALTSAGSLGLPTDVGAVVPVTPALHYKVNIKFWAGGIGALDFFDANADGLSGPCVTSFTAGFYYANVPPTISDIPDTVTYKNHALGPVPFTVGDVETPLGSLVVTARSSNTAVVDNTGLSIGGSGASRNITVTPQTDQIGSTVITVTVFDGVDSTSDTFNLLVSDLLSLTVRKVRDGDGDPGTLLDQTPRLWELAVYKDSVNPSHLVTEGTTTELVADNLVGGTYIACEADSGGSWTRLNGNHTRYDTLQLDYNALATVDTFLNFRPNSLSVYKYLDFDGNIYTPGDRVAKSWHLEIHKDSPGGAIMAQGDATSIASTSLGDGTYYAVEADSAGWVSLGYTTNSSTVAGEVNTVEIALADGQSETVSFINAPPVYSAMYRSFSADSIALDRDYKGKIGKYLKRKAIRDDFSFFVIPTDSVNDLHVEFNQAIESAFPFTISPNATATNPDGKRKKWDFTFPSKLGPGDSVVISGYGNKGKPIKVGKYYWTLNGTILGAKLKNPPFTRNDPKLPMPNRINVLLEAFEQGGFSASGGLAVGLNKKAPVDSSKQYGWIVSPKYKDVLKTLSDKTGRHSGGIPQGLDKYISGKPILKQLKSLPPGKQKNPLVANLTVLKLNIVASALGKTPAGFGELIFNWGDADSCTNLFNGMTVKQISAAGDSIIMGWYSGLNHDFDDCKIHGLNTAADMINNSFEGAMDTLNPGFTTKLYTKGTKRLIDVPYLQPDFTTQPTIMQALSIPISQVPDAYALYQNYPNPFNPTTTISFDLPEESFVTLKIYNLLGQEVATLLNREQLDDGTQEVQFNAGSLASGVYFYRIVAQGIDEDGVVTSTFTTVRKMLLVK